MKEYFILYKRPDDLFEIQLLSIEDSFFVEYSIQSLFCIFDFTIKYRIAMVKSRKFLEYLYIFTFPL